MKLRFLDTMGWLWTEMSGWVVQTTDTYTHQTLIFTVTVTVNGTVSVTVTVTPIPTLNLTLKKQFSIKDQAGPERIDPLRQFLLLSLTSSWYLSTNGVIYPEGVRKINIDKFRLLCLHLRDLNIMACRCSDTCDIQRVFAILLYGLSILGILAVSIVCFTYSHKIYPNVYNCSNGLTYFQNVTGLLDNVSCSEHENEAFSEHQVGWGLVLLIAIAWLLGHSVDSLGWTLSKMLSVFIFVYPLVLNCVEVKIDELCKSTQNVDDCYIIQQAVVNDSLIHDINVAIVLLILLGPCVFFLMYMLGIYCYVKFISGNNNAAETARICNTRDQILNPDENAYKIGKKNGNCCWLWNTVTDDDISSRMRKILLLNLLLQMFSICLAVFVGPNMLVFLYHMLFVHNNLSKNVSITSLFNPIKHDNEFLRRELLDFMGIVFIMYFARAMKYLPYKNTDQITFKSFWTYINDTFWNFGEAAEHAARLVRMELQRRTSNV